jgi:L-rhamnose 1-dehydrogenase
VKATGRLRGPDKTVSATAMAQLLHGKATAITGAVTGIGRAIALEYLQQGASVAVNYYPDSGSEQHFKSLVAEASAGDRLIGVPGDISNKETAIKLVEETVESFGKLDVFVSNAGVCQFADFLE